MESVTVTASQLTKLFSILSCKWSRWNPDGFAPSLLRLEFGQLNAACSTLFDFLRAAAASSSSSFFFFSQICKSYIYFCSAKVQLGCPIFQSFFPWPPFPPSDSYPADCLRTKTHARPSPPLTDWQWQRGALPHQDMVHRDTKLQKQSIPQGWSSLLLSLCAAQPPTWSTRTSAAFYVTYCFICPWKRRYECSNS